MATHLAADLVASLLPHATVHHDGEDRDAWLEARRRLVTASELSALITQDSSNDYRDSEMFGSVADVYTMWYDKVHGYREPFDAYSAERMASGQAREAGIIESLGSVVPSKALFVHPEHRIGATLDGFALDSVYEVKSPGWFAPKKCPDLWVKWPPQKYVMQLGVQMYVVGASHGYIVARSERTGETRRWKYLAEQFNSDVLTCAADTFLSMVDTTRFRRAALAAMTKHEIVRTVEACEL